MNRTRLTKIEKMRLLANRRMFNESNQRQLKQIEKDKLEKLMKEIKNNFNNEKENLKEKGKNISFIIYISKNFSKFNFFFLKK